MKLDALKARVGRLIGIDKWQLNESGKLDMPEEKLIELADICGESVIELIESDLKKTQFEQQAENKHKSKTMSKTEKKWTGLCSHLGVESMEMSDDGVFLNEEQLDKIEAALADSKTRILAAEGVKTTAEAAQKAAENSLAETATALDDLDASVKEAKDLNAKVEAVRAVLAQRPAVAPTGSQSKKDGKMTLEGADPVNAFVRENL